MEIEALKSLKARYFRLLDTKDWEQWTQVWAPEIDHEMPMEGQKYRGPREAFVKSVSAALDGAITCHHGHTCEIEITSPTTARAIWAFQDYLTPSPGARPTAPNIVGFGHYHEAYIKTDAGWKIESQKVTRLRIDKPGRES